MRPMRRIVSLVFLFVFLFQFSIAAKAEVNVPARVGDIYVQDHANVLSEDEKAQLLTLGRKLEDLTTAQIGVLTVNSLNGNDIASFSNAAFRKYGLGQKNKNNGILIVVSLKEKKIRLEIGYGLEGAVTDVKSGSILDTYAIPFLKAGDTGAAIVNTYKAVYNEVLKEYKVADGNTVTLKKPTAAKSPLSTFTLILIAIGTIILITLDFKFFGGTFTFLILNLLSNSSRRGGGGSRGGGGGSSGGGGASRGW
ncbi:YgcG family protein [Bacillus sp. MUM 116]|uniref:TPM domain-containing protein n=1 Tax=Bacillus sp. MUM 116 TaxID=1678002 RepID=UPI0021090B99|nr:TPM domain-containing protein [Bacillus sp. MUM 116]